MYGEVALGNVMVDCNDEKALQRFYGELLGWEMCELFARPAVRSSNGIVFLFIEEPDYVPPVWPEENGKQQKINHIKQKDRLKRSFCLALIDRIIIFFLCFPAF